MSVALRALRERYQATSGNTVEAFRRLATQLSTSPGALEVVETLRRELHRVHGTAGSYGFPEASKLAAAFEEVAIRWAGDAALDREDRARMTGEFASRLAVLLAAAPGTPDTAASQEAPVAALAPVEVVFRPPSDVPDLIVVEDDPSFVEMLQYALGMAGFSYRHYATGPEALAALLFLDTQGQHPLILLDIDLPGLDGFSLHERLRVERPGVYATVFVTARGGEAEQLRAYRAGAIDYLPKPVSLRILMAKIPTWLGRSSGRP